MKSGSAFVAARKASRASSYQNECNAATPRRKWLCAWSEPEVGNSTLPSWDSWIPGPAPEAMGATAISRRHAMKLEILRRMVSEIAQARDERQCSRLDGKIGRASCRERV